MFWHDLFGIIGKVCIVFWETIIFNTKGANGCGYIRGYSHLYPFLCGNRYEIFYPGGYRFGLERNFLKSCGYGSGYFLLCG